MKKGFTIIEIIVVIAIIVVVSSMSAVYLRSYRTQAILENNVRDITVDLRLASEKASATQIPHEVRFDIVNSNYVLVQTGEPEIIIKQSTLDSQLTITNTTLPNNTAIFNTLGGVANPGTLTISHQSGPVSIINIRPSGYIKIE